MKPKAIIFLTIIFSFVIFAGIKSHAQFPAIPLNAQPGAIMNHQMNTFWLQQRTPWITNPTTHNQIQPPKSEVLVHDDFFKEETSTQGMLITPDGNAYIVGE